VWNASNNLSSLQEQQDRMSAITMDIFSHRKDDNGIFVFERELERSNFPGLG